MGDLQRLEIFRAGQHQDEHGTIDAYTVDDLQQMAESFNPELSCPLAIGHVDSASPAYGWAKKVWVEGDRLYADIGECVDAVRRWLSKKFYNKVSIEVFPPDHLSNPTPGKWNLARICLLGAAPPAIAGGPPVIPFRFSSAELRTYTYNLMPNKTPQEQLDELSAQVEALKLEIGKQEFAAAVDDMEPMEEDEEEPIPFAADDPLALDDMGDMGDTEEMDMEEEPMEDMETEAMANPFIDELMIRAGLDLQGASDSSGVPLDLINAAIAGGTPLSPEDLTAVMDALFGGGGAEMPMFSAHNPKMLEQLQQLKTRLARQEADLNKFSAFVEAEHKLLQSERAELEKNKIKAFCADLVAQHKIRPTEEAETVELILAADNKEKRSYAAGEESKTHRAKLMEAYSNRPPLVDTTPIEAGGNYPGVVSGSAPRAYSAAASELELSRAVRARQAETGESFREAYHAIINKNLGALK